MRVLFLSPAYHPMPGGGERYARALAEHLAERGTAVTVLTSHARHEQELWRGAASPPTQTQEGQITVIRLPIRPFPGGRNGLLAYRKLMVLLSALPGDQSRLLGRMARLIPPLVGLEDALAKLPADFDLVHAFNISWEWPLWAGWQWARERGLPFVATPFMHFGAGHDRVALNATMDHQRRLLVGADRVLVLTAVEQTGLQQMGVERVAVIGGGVDEVAEGGETAVVRQQHRLMTPYALFIGRASHDKGAIHAAQAALALAAQGADVTLALIGQPAPEFTRFYDRLSPTEQARIRPLGILNDAEKHALLAGAVALLLPSRTDSFGIVLLEAWAHGVPVIGADAGGIPGVIDDGQNGLLVPFGDVAALGGALRRLLDDPALRQQLGEQGRQKVARQYTWPQVAARALDQYDQILTNGRSR
jgi:glycogen synthase